MFVWFWRLFGVCGSLQKSFKTASFSSVDSLLSESGKQSHSQIPHSVYDTTLNTKIEGDIAQKEDNFVLNFVWYLIFLPKRP